MFWIIAAIIAGLCALALSRPFWRASGGAASRAQHDMEAFRAQLTEIEQDLARGVLGEAEAETARIEVSRRLLAASERAERESVAAETPGGSRKALALAAGLAAPVLALALYAGLGTPGAPGMPLEARKQAAAEAEANRPSQAQAEAIAQEKGLVPEMEPPAPMAGMPDFETLIARLEERLAETPDDRRGRELLARATARLGRFSDSWRHYATLIDGDFEAATAPMLGDMVESMVMAAGGYVSPEAERATALTLRKDDTEPRARHFKALALAQRGDLAPALEQWTTLLRDAPPDAPWREGVLDDARQAAQELGVALPADVLTRAAAPGPDRAQMEAAAEMTPEARAAMIEGMVAGLAERLSEDPDDLQGWLRLIRAYRVLGRSEDAAAAAATAQAAFAEDPAALALLEQALQ